MTEGNIDKQNLLDLLVDGELAEDERRNLLAWCEREPDGWRRCALAFLEAQSWSQVLGNLTEPLRQPLAEKRSAHEAAVQPLSADPSVEQARHSLGRNRHSLGRNRHSLGRNRHSLGRNRQWRTALAMAASVALAFTLGVWVRDAGKVERIVPRNGAAVNLVENKGNLVENKSPPRLLPGRPEQGPPQVEVAVGGLSQAAGQTQPMMSGDGWLMVEPSAMPADVQRALERMGHRVEQRRQLVPYRLQDGRRLVVPVDQVEVQPVGNRGYQ